MPLDPITPDVADQLHHGNDHPLVACDDCGCLVVPALIRTHERVCPGAVKPNPLTALARRILGIKP